MPQFPEIRNFKGLYLQTNSFDVPDGALEQAQNVVVAKDGIITKRRGFYTYFDPSSGTLNRLFFYQNILLAAYAAKMSYYTDTGSSPNETGSETNLTGETVSITAPRVSRSFQSNDNLYFTTDNGVLKITAYNSAISKTGAPQGLDLVARFINGSSATWFAPVTESGNFVSTTVGYRVVFGYRDANDNLILGSPSDIATITNTAVNNVVASAAGTTITVTSTAHGLETGQYLVFGNAAGFTTSSNADGVYQITVTGANSFTYVVSSGPGGGPGTVDYAYAMPVRLEFSVPSEVTTALPWFYQVYRSSQQLEAVGVLSDFKLADEQMLTSAQIAADVVFFTDDIDDILLGAELYTNENSREGELQANSRPPLCDDVTLYKGFAFYANCTTRHLLDLALIDATQLANNDYIEIKIALVTRRYVARTGVGNLTVRGTCSSSAGLLITYTAHGLQNNDTVYIANITGGTLTAGTYFVVSAAANDFKISLTSGGAAIAYNGETSLEFQGVTNGTNPIFTLSQSSSASVRLRDTAQGIVKAVNRDPSSLVYAQYVSGINDVPGKMRFQAKGFTDPMFFRANTTTAGSAFSPALPDSFASGTQVYSLNDDLPHAVFISKFNEPEAVPLVNFLLVGSKNKQILRVHALRDSVIFEKEDGVYRLTGDVFSNFAITLLDGTVQCVAASSSDVLNNQVIFLSNQGVCMVTESAVQIVSRKIEDVIQPILGQSGLSAQTSGVAYETERLYLLTTTDPNSTTATQTYAYNVLTEAWTSWTSLFSQAAIGPGDALFYISTANDIQKERKKQTKIDYCGQNYLVTISSVSVDLMSCNVTMPSGVTPQKGDVIVKAGVINRIGENPIFISGDTYFVEFTNDSNLANADSVILYSQYSSVVKFAPFHAGLVGRMKFFSQMQIHLRENSVSRLSIFFTGDTYGGSEDIEWESGLIALGWGLFPWSFEPWGQTEFINLTQGTRPAPIIRIYVPRFQARNTFIQAVLQHDQAGEPMNLQSLSFAVRAYGERVSR